MCKHGTHKSGRIIKEKGIVPLKTKEEVIRQKKGNATLKQRQ